MYNEVMALNHIHNFAKNNPEFREAINFIPKKLDSGMIYVNK